MTLLPIKGIFITQRKLNRPEQLPEIMASISLGAAVEPITLSKFEDGSIQVDDGHHRLVAYILCGRSSLNDDEYVLLPRDNYKNRFGTIQDLVSRTPI